MEKDIEGRSENYDSNGLRNITNRDNADIVFLSGLLVHNGEPHCATISALVERGLKEHKKTILAQICL